MTNRVRVVIDTNLVLSALVFGGATARLRTVWQDDLVLPLASNVTMNELRRVLTYPKFRLTETEQIDLLADYLPFCDMVTIPELMPDLPDCRDPYDVPFLALALAGKADYLVTGDRDLLCLVDLFPCPIVTASQFFLMNDLS